MESCSFIPLWEILDKNFSGDIDNPIMINSNGRPVGDSHAITASDEDSNMDNVRKDGAGKPLMNSAILSLAAHGTEVKGWNHHKLSFDELQRNRDDSQNYTCLDKSLEGYSYKKNTGSSPKGNCVQSRKREISAMQGGNDDLVQNYGYYEQNSNIKHSRAGNDVARLRSYKDNGGTSCEIQQKNHPSYLDLKSLNLKYNRDGDVNPSGNSLEIPVGISKEAILTLLKNTPSCSKLALAAMADIVRNANP